MLALRYQDGNCPLDIAGERAGSAAVTGRPGRTAAAQGKKVQMMAEVACFCGCFYSFDGGAGACPKCGEYATVTGGRRAGTGGHDMIIQTRMTTSSWRRSVWPSSSWATPPIGAASRPSSTGATAVW